MRRKRAEQPYCPRSRRLGSLPGSRCDQRHIFVVPREVADKRSYPTETSGTRVLCVKTRKRSQNGSLILRTNFVSNTSQRCGCQLSATTNALPTPCGAIAESW
jgi:hypothetical protein